MERFLAQEIVKKCNFLAPEIFIMTQLFFGPRNRQNGTISGSRNRPKTKISGPRNLHYGSTLFLAPEIVKMGQFLAPEIVNLIKRSFMEQKEEYKDGLL